MIRVRRSDCLVLQYKRRLPESNRCFGAQHLLPLLARYLEHPDVGDARGLTYGPQALSCLDSLTDGRAPLGLGSGTARRSAPHAGQREHLESVDHGLPVRDLEVKLGLGDSDGSVLGAGGGEVPLDRVDAAQVLRVFPVGLCGDAVCVHAGNLAYRRASVKGWV